MEKISPRPRNLRAASPPIPPKRKTVAVTAAIAALSAALTSLAHPAALRVDGERMLSDVPPVTTAKTAYVPLRVIAERLGADTNYDPKTGLIELIRAGDTMRLHVGDRYATLNGKKLVLRTAPFSVRGRTMVPLQVIASAFKTHVRYDTAHAQIDVLTSGPDDPSAEGVTATP
jgi:hypothetical protein